MAHFTVDIKEYQKGFRVDETVWGKACMDAYRNGDTQPALRLVIGEKQLTRLWVIGDETMDDYLRLLEEEHDRQASA